MPTITRDNAHNYSVDGRGPYASVTTIIDSSVSKAGMLASVRRKAIEYVLWRNPSAPMPATLDARARLLESEITRESFREAERGDRVHQALEHLVGNPLSVLVGARELAPYLYQFGLFSQKYEPRWIASERKVVSEAEGIGGTVDALGFFSDAPDDLTVVDFKTGRWTWGEHILQVNAYARMLIDEGEPIKRAAILHLNIDGFEWVTVPLTEDAWRAFLGAKVVHDWLAAQPR